MANAAIPFAPNQQSGFDSINAAVALAVNVVIDKSGTVRRRPGVAPLAAAPATAIDPSGVDGVYVTTEGKVYAAGGNPGARKLYRLVGGSSLDLSAAIGGTLAGPGRPTWAETEAMVAIAAGGVPQKILVATDDSSRLGGSPPSATHVAANASRLLLNNVDVNLNRMSFSSPASGTATAGHEEWVSGDAGFITGESRPDPVVALAENGNEVFMFGSTSFQVFAPSPEDVYSPVAARDVGCIAPYSVVRHDATFFWLDQRRRVVQSDGREVRVVSEQIQATLEELSEVRDAFAYRVHEGPCDVVVFTFPSDGRSLVYQVGGGWSEWMGWSETSNNFARLGVNAAAANPVTGENVVGMVDGRMGVMRLAANSDLGAPIPVRLVTGHLNRGTDEVKQCLAVRLSFRRGRSVSGPEPVAHLSWRDDEGEWSPPLELGLGTAGDRLHVVSLRGLGTYRRRQWRLDFDGDSEFVLAGAAEEFQPVEE